ncbi:PhoX family protein [Marinitenerispora sediminis]|uniref:Phosphatase n=1 Tax=Marinitenerispora sediminis TaxID=1931232 RepID=A0A368SZI5_9ACTN|nr:PhoX family phosphatase [Marinitenerispora sediminis]RCV50927.1 phosphatase [Marinitenerispora sediminis]RCV57934.1 phosphatase [Marinitenerispora sediminis]RCV62333.1 phosphatase [Marinitenerispora sediminis]
MPDSAPRRRLLPLISHAGGRSRTTCRFRCGDACFHEAPNTSANEYFGDVFTAALSRRNVLRAGAVSAGASALAFGVGAAPATAAPRNPRLGFTSVAPNTADAVTVPQGYDHRVVVRWGDPVVPGAPEFDFAGQTAEAQERQFGYNCDYVSFVELDNGRGLLWVNHEYTNENIMFAGYSDGAAADLEQIRISMAAHGGSIVEIERVGRTGAWKLVTSGRRRYNRRITASTPMRLTGPAAGDALLRTAADPEGTEVLGMLNNCSGGMTPWGTVLTCEENFNQYFVGGEGAPEDVKPKLRRYGIAVQGDTRAGNRRFDRVDERFDLSKHPNEANRFGYVVEIDPLDPDYQPRKRTMLGRFKHEAANTRITADGRVAVYMGDDERFDYIYKFVSEKRYRKGSRRHNDTLLDSGTLYVAKLTGNSPAEEIDGSGALPEDGEFDGSGTWIPLCDATTSYVDGFTVAEVLVHTRLAADAVGATKMDRPEDFEASPVTGKVYCALTNNSSRTPEQADEANPRANNRYGHILEITERRNDAGATAFGWKVPVVCGDPEDPSTYFSGYDKSKVAAISSPDNLTFDASGNLWIATDGQPGTLDHNDALHAVPVEGKYRGELKTFATVPYGAECCGPFITEDQKTVFIAPQHPGEDGTVEQPQSTWPNGDFPRPSVVSIWHTRGRKIGS